MRTCDDRDARLAVAGRLRIAGRLRMARSRDVRATRGDAERAREHARDEEPASAEEDERTRPRVRVRRGRPRNVGRERRNGRGSRDHDRVLHDRLDVVVRQLDDLVGVRGRHRREIGEGAKRRRELARKIVLEHDVPHADLVPRGGSSKYPENAAKSRRRVTRDAAYASSRRARRDACVTGGSQRQACRAWPEACMGARMLTLVQAVEAQARRRPDAIALASDGAGPRIGFAALLERSARLAASLAEDHGVGRGDRVAVLALNDVRTFELLVACSRLGAALAPLNVRLSDAELEAVLARCEPKALFVDDAHAARAPACSVLRRPLDAAIPDSTGAHAPIAGTLDDTLVLLFTSGTTGKPKGAMLTQRSIAANAESTRLAWGLDERDVALIDAPLFHTGGLNVLATPLLYAGGTVIVAPRFDAVASGETLVREGCTVAFGVPTMIERLLAAGVVDRSRIRLYVTGGAPCPRTLLDAFAAKGASLVQGFGMTECGPNCFRPRAGAVPGSIGEPTSGLEMRLVGEDGREVASGEAGELLLRGPHVFAGYFRDDTATHAALDRDGWLHTGDLLRATPEGWFVAGRKKEMFISGGENVYPAEVEMAFTLHAAVAEAAVISVADPKWGEAGVAYVLARAGAPEPTPEALRAFLRERIAAYKVPRAIHVERELPRTASGKIDKRALSARNQERASR